MCCIFAEDDPEVAKEKWSSQIVQEYGSHCNGHCLYTWDRGERYLARCKHCGKLLLIQESEYSFCGADESFYTDIFPVKSTEEAEFLNQEYDGFSLESEFKRKALFLTNGKPSWH